MFLKFVESSIVYWNFQASLDVKPERRSVLKFGCSDVPYLTGNTAPSIFTVPEAVYLSLIDWNTLRELSAPGCMETLLYSSKRGLPEWSYWLSLRNLEQMDGLDSMDLCWCHRSDLNRCQLNQSDPASVKKTVHLVESKVTFPLGWCENQRIWMW